MVSMRRAASGRLPELLPFKYGRMAASAFGFFRGAAPIMAADLARLAVSGIAVQICGDAHVRNLGAYAAPDGRIVFDINDFDETLVGPWEWDLKRLATSFVLAGREASCPERVCRDAAESVARAWRESLARFANMPALELARYTIHRHLDEGPVHPVLRKAERATPLVSLEKLTVKARRGLRRFAHRPPLLTRLPEEQARRVLRALMPYRETVGPARQVVLDAYRAEDVAFKIVGTGSIGTRDYVVLAFGGPHDPLFLQVKQELASCWAPWSSRRQPAPHQGRRVAAGGGPRCPGHADQAGQARPAGQVDAVGHPAGQSSHLQSEATDDHRRGRLGPQEPTDASNSP